MPPALPSAEASPCAAPRLAFDAAVGLALQEMERLGLAATHHFAGLYAAPDAHTEGADFAATLVRRDGKRRGDGARLKLLIACDGRISVCPFARRCARPCRAASRC
jgi:hypothetical protein